MTTGRKADRQEAWKKREMPVEMEARRKAGRKDGSQDEWWGKRKEGRKEGRNLGSLGGRCVSIGRAGI
jgi:hypothetical protein